MKFLKNSVLILLSFLFFIFEDIIWTKLVKPVFNFIKTFHIFQIYVTFLSKQNKYIILFAFLFQFIFAEVVLGAYSLYLLASGSIVLSAFFYILKLILAVSAFSILKECKEILFSFVWFKKTYEFIVILSDRIKASKYYILMKEKILEIKNMLKEKLSGLKYFFKVFVRFIKFVFAKFKKGV